MSNEDLFKGLKINIPKIDPPQQIGNMVFKQHEDTMESINKAMKEKYKREAEDRQVQKNIEVNTMKIADNTEWLSQSVNLIRINNERQTELLEIISEILALSNEDDKVVAERKLKSILDKVQGFKDNYDLMMFLKEFGDYIINLATNINV